MVKFRCVGPVVMVKCARNSCEHLRGNFYVQYSHDKYASDAVGLLDGHVYEGERMEVELCNVKNWKAAVCARFVPCTLLSSYETYCLIQLLSLRFSKIYPKR